ncbi:flagellar protein FlaG [Neisseriaceae bacterium TC5R-5]|nr:flagellar protein FlaG [Neisseriaceae bacterium TC5R-5]
MQIPSMSPLSPVSVSPTQLNRQQAVELAQNTTQQGATGSVLPDSAQAVAALGQLQGQQAQGDATKQNAKKTPEEQLQESLKQLNNTASLVNDQLEFSVDKDTNQQVVKVVDKETQKVIRQIPSEDAIQIAKAIDQFKGLLLKDQA